ncbi:MAG: IS1595 family transposase [Defluviicoccus sp.]|nr:IS1595 family transposase [Defluviicoccus sp.]MDE0385933.1 IS1595 family transposase [Defluviicoccus sp.]
MAQKAPGKSHREGITLTKLIRMFPNDDAAREWFESRIWPEGPYCPKCGSLNVQSGIRHKTMTHRCRDCEGKPRFSLKTGTIMEGSKLGYQTWALAVYLVATNLKGVSSMKLHRDLGVTQKTAWHLAHRIRKSLEEPEAPFSGPVEVDETYIGGKRKNMSNAKRRALRDIGRGTAGKATVIGAKDRATNSVAAQQIASTNKATLQGFVGTHTAPGATVYTDEHGSYEGMPFEHEAVKHSAREYVRGQAHTNGMESFWAMLKRGYNGTFHHFSEKHTGRYVTEFAGRHNMRNLDTIDQMEWIVEGMIGQRLRYPDLIA